MKMNFKYITNTYVNYCKLSKEYIIFLSEIVSILVKKVDFLADPVVNKKSTGDTQGIKELVIRLKDNQVEILADQEQVYKDDSCDEFLSTEVDSLSP